MSSRIPAHSALSGRAGAAARWGTPAEADEARADLAEARISDYVRCVVDAAPPLGPERRRRLAALLAGPDAAPAMGAVSTQGGAA